MDDVPTEGLPECVTLLQGTHAGGRPAGQNNASNELEPDPVAFRDADRWSSNESSADGWLARWVADPAAVVLVGLSFWVRRGVSPVD